MQSPPPQNEKSKFRTHLSHHSHESPSLEGTQRNTHEVLVKEGTYKEDSRRSCRFAVSEFHQRNI